MRRATLALLPALLAAPALAQDRPRVTPARDVSVTYRMSSPGAAGGQPMAMTMSWLAANGLMRSDIPGLGWAVVDSRAGRAFMVMEGMRMIMDIPPSQAMQAGGIPANATFRREGTATVAGLPCTVWSYQDPEGTGRSCLTADGVMLRAEGTRGGHSGGMEATAVTYAAQDPSRFQRPQGYQSMQGLGGMVPGAPPARPPGTTPK